MKSLFRYAFLGFLISASLAAVACARGKNTALPPAELSNETSLQVMGKDSQGKSETIQVTVAGEERPYTWLGFIDLDGKEKAANFISPNNLEAANGQIQKIVMENGEVILVVTYYLSKEAKDAKVLVFKGESGKNSYTLVKDQNFLPELKLEAKTRNTTEELIDMLVTWLELHGLAGLETYADSFDEHGEPNI